jgi:hypothetical protein
MNYRIRPGAGLWPGDNEDVTLHIISFLNVRDVGRLSTVSVGLFHDAEREAVWAPLWDSYMEWLRTLPPECRGPRAERILGDYPENIHSKRKCAVAEYHTRSWQTTRLPPWNMTIGPERMRRLADGIEHFKTKRVHVYQRMREARRDVGLWKSRLATMVDRLAESLEDDSLDRFHGRMRAVTRLGQRYAAAQSQERQAERDIENWCMWIEDYVDKLKNLTENKRLHDVFTPYLRNFWFFSQTMWREPAGPYAKPPLDHPGRCHAMQTRSRILAPQE